MKLDLVGKVKNTQLPKSKALLPMFEAVVNSFQAIEDVASKSGAMININVLRELSLPETGPGEVQGFEIIDTGIGFNSDNFDSFFTSDTQYKIARGGKGLGRFMWLKAFDRAEIESHFALDGAIRKRSFVFDLVSDQPKDATMPSSLSRPKTILKLIGMKKEYQDHCPKSLDVIGHRLVEHCLPFFLDPQCPRVSISDEAESINLNNYFRDTFGADMTEHNFKVKDVSFSMKGLRLYHPLDPRHKIIYAANSREVLTERLDRFVPNLRWKLEDSESGGFVYLGFVESEFLNNRVNGERTGFSFPEEERREEGEFFDEITLHAIRMEAIECANTDLREYLGQINKDKTTAITNYIREQAPEYKPLIRYLSEFIDRIPPETQPRDLEMKLHEQIYEKQSQIREETAFLMDESVRAKDPQYETKLRNFIERANELGKSSLAQYVAHRKVVLDFLEASLRPRPGSSKYELEESIHNLIFPMRTTSEDVPYEQQNLWIIDERLSYHWFLASDKQLNKIDPLNNESKLRPDLLIFDRALTFGEDESPLTAIVVVEFKKPDRSDYRLEDPISQVYRQIREIKTGYFKDKNGREIKVQSEQVPAYAYIVCDKTQEIDIIAQDKGLHPTPDNLGYFGYNPHLNAYVEIISYTKLLNDAKKRNRILFEKLNLTSTAAVATNAGR